MKKPLLLSLVFFLFLLIGCGNEITEEDEAEILETVKNYYRALERERYSFALSQFYYEPGTKVEMFEHYNRGHALEEINELTGYSIDILELPDKSEENTTSFGSKPPDRSLRRISVDIKVSYDKKEDIEIREELLLKNHYDSWKIKRISSFDKYVVLRAYGYYYYDQDTSVN